METARTGRRLRNWAGRVLQGAYPRMVDSWRSTSNLLFPAFCQLCGEELDRPPYLCSCCRQALLSGQGPACRRCASPVPDYWTETLWCPRCYDRHYAFDQAVALGPYNGLWRTVVLCLKRASFDPLAWSVAALLAQRIGDGALDRLPDLVVAPPMHWTRRWQRGTHTARVLAAGIARPLQLPHRSGLLRCQRKTLKQGTLSPAERRRNVRGAYRLRTAGAVRGQQVLVVDDVMTTGATLNEVARLLRRAGASWIGVAVVARGVGQ